MIKSIQILILGTSLFFSFSSNAQLYFQVDAGVGASMVIPIENEFEIEQYNSIRISNPEPAFSQYVDINFGKRFDNWFDLSGGVGFAVRTVKCDFGYQNGPYSYYYSDELNKLNMSIVSANIQTRFYLGEKRKFHFRLGGYFGYLLKGEFDGSNVYAYETSPLPEWAYVDGESFEATEFLNRFSAPVNLGFAYSFDEMDNWELIFGVNNQFDLLNPDLRFYKFSQLSKTPFFTTSFTVSIRYFLGKE